MPKMMQDLIEQYVEAVKKIYGSHVRQIILYGSYARGDYKEISDIDIMILVKMTEEEIRLVMNDIYDLANAFNRFYHETKILAEEDEQKQKSYIALLTLTRDILTTCIDLLGFEAPVRM